jgi:hypothetical protein
MSRVSYILRNKNRSAGEVRDKLHFYCNLPDIDGNKIKEDFWLKNKIRRTVFVFNSAVKLNKIDRLDYYRNRGVGVGDCQCPFL